MTLALSLAIGGCSGPKPAFVPAASVVIGIGGFYQPTSTKELLAGYLPEQVERVDGKIFPQLDNDFEEMLRSGTSRDYVGSERSYQCIRQEQGKEHNSAFPFWVAVGKCMNVDLVIVPQVQAWQERLGGEMGVEQPAAVIMDFFLLDVKNQSLIARSRYDETQKALASNLLDMGKFIERGGKWVSAGELAREGMAKAVKELGL
jgi:hypothetical protein